jgi:hypothetical protein
VLAIGGPDAQFVTIIEQLFNDQIDAGIDGILCPILRPIIETNLTQLLLLANQTIQPYLDPPSPNGEILPGPLPPVYYETRNTTKFVRLNETSLISALNYLLNGVVNLGGPVVQHLLVRIVVFFFRLFVLILCAFFVCSFCFLPAFCSIWLTCFFFVALVPLLFPLT